MNCRQPIGLRVQFFDRKLPVDVERYFWFRAVLVLAEMCDMDAKTLARLLKMGGFKMPTKKAIDAELARRAPLISLARRARTLRRKSQKLSANTRART